MPSQTAIPGHLIHTKLYPPRVPERLVRRQELIDHLNEGRNRPLTLISAPAGYGKSTLVHEWLKTNEEPFAWLSLDASDSELGLFLDYLITALGNAHAEIGGDTRSLLKRPQLPDPESLADSLLRDLQGLGQPVYLAIDDFHTIRNNDVYLFMTRLVRRLPETLHLVLISRADPPLGLAQLRGRGQLREIRSNDLRFTPQETATLLELIIGESIDSDTVNLLTERTEGWPAGLRMAAMSLRASGDPREFTSKYAEGGHKLVSDYLLSEVLNRLPDEDRLLLLRTSMVSRVCAPLIDVLATDSIPGRDGYDFLEMLWSANFFLIALDDQGAWYRFHHLFRQLLEQQMLRTFSHEDIVAMQRQASLWFESNGYVEDAVRHALQAGDEDHAAVIVENHVHDPLNEEDWRLVERWIHLLPEQARGRPGLLATQAMLEQFRYRLDIMLSLLDAAEEGLRSGKYAYTSAQEQTWLGAINTFRSVMWTPVRTSEDALRYVALALQQVEPEAKYVRSVAELGEILAMQMAGKEAEALRLARRKLASRIGPPDAITSRLMIAHSFVLYCEADVHGVHNATRTYLDLAQRSGQQISVSWLLFIRGWAHYQANKLDQADAYFRQLLTMRDNAHVRNVVDSIIGLLLIYSARGEQAEIRSLLDDLRQFVIEQGVASMLPVADSLALRLNLNGRTGVSTAEFRADPEAQLAADLWELPVLTDCRQLIFNGGEEQLVLAENALASCRAFAASRNNKRQMMQIDALQALLFEMSGEHQQALDSLKKAVLLGEPGGALRYFIDIGPDLIPLLRELRSQAIATAYVDRILDVYGVGVESETLPEYGRTEMPPVLNPEAAAMIAEFTNREMDVLHLLNERLTNKEIAEKLHLSPYTVKQYTLSIYKKLDVNGRRQAVARASELGIL